jgi:hypothetical protein
MAIQVECHGCGRVLKTKDENAGRRAKFPDCQTALTFPEADAAEDYDYEYEEQPRRRSSSSRQSSKSRSGKSRKTAAAARPWYAIHWQWFVIAAALLMAMLPTHHGLMPAGLAFLAGLILMFIGGCIPILKIIAGQPGTAILLVLSPVARIRMMREPDDHPYKVLSREAFGATGGLFWRGLLLALCIIPALMINSSDGWQQVDHQPKEMDAATRAFVEESKAHHEAARKEFDERKKRREEWLRLNPAPTMGTPEYKQWYKKRMAFEAGVDVDSIPEPDQTVVTSNASPNAGATESPTTGAEPATAATPGDSATKTESTPARDGVWKVGDKASVEWGAKWLPVVVLATEGSDKVKIHWEGYSDSFDEVVDVSKLKPRDAIPAVKPPTTKAGPKPAQGGPWKVGDKASVEWASKWLPVVVLATEGSDKVKIHWEGYADAFDEVVDVSKLKPRDAVPTEKPPTQ